MAHQQVWFAEVPSTEPWHGYITDDIEGIDCAVISYAPVVPPIVEDPPTRTASSEDEWGNAPSSTQQPTPAEVPAASTMSTPTLLSEPPVGLVTPVEQPNLYTVLDPGQAVPPLMDQAKAMGFVVSYSLHGYADARITL